MRNVLLPNIIGVCSESAVYWIVITMYGETFLLQTKSQKKEH